MSEKQASNPTPAEQRKAIENSIADYKHAIALMDDLKRLENSPAWQRLITEHYLKEYALRLVMLKADPAMQKSEQQLDIENTLRGLAEFNIFLHYVGVKGRKAEQILKDANAELDMIDEEEAAAAEEEEAASNTN